MATIWSNRDGDWRLLKPVPFDDEAALHSLIEEAPTLLPLAGSPELVVLGREVQLGNGAADLLAVEPDGRLAVIEIKLAKNAEARRAVVAQTLAYAAYLRGMSPEDLEAGPLRRHLADSLANFVQERDESGAFDIDTFRDGLADCLSTGFFRLVIVLDDVPTELERIVGYLGAVTRDGLMIDLVRVEAYEVAGERIIVPTRVEPGREPPPVLVRGGGSGRARTKPIVTEGSARFREILEREASSSLPASEPALEWAERMEREGLATLVTSEGRVYRTLQVRSTRADTRITPAIFWCNSGIVTLEIRSATGDLLAGDGQLRLTAVSQTANRATKSGYSWVWDATSLPSELLDILSEAYRGVSPVQPETLAPRS